MVNWLIQWSLTNRLAVLALAALLMTAGFYVTASMPVDVFPDLSSPRVAIIVEGHGMATEEMGAMEGGGTSGGSCAATSWSFSFTTCRAV